MKRSTAADTDATERGIGVGDLQRYLSGLADLQRDSRTGNAALAAAIRSLVDALKPYRSRPALELPELLAGLVAPRQPKPAHRKPAVELPSGLTTLTESAVERVLADNRYLKSQLADLGFQRFGISRSRLCRLSKADAVEAIRAALEHQRSLDAISQQARAAGRRRSVGYTEDTLRSTRSPLEHTPPATAP